MPGHKTTHTQLERFRLIDSMLADGEVLAFEKMLDAGYERITCGEKIIF